MLAKLCYFVGTEDGQHVNFKNAWFCRETKEKTGSELGQSWAFNPTTYIHIYIYIYIHMFLVRSVL